MGKKRLRSEASSLSDSDEATAAATAQKKFKRDKWSVPESLWKQVDLCQKLYEFLRKYRGESTAGGSHCLSDFLLRTPSRRLQPEYYDTVPSPIDLSKIQQKLKADEYSSVVAFVADVRLLLQNAKLFYPHSSTEYKSAVTLEKAFLQQMEECFQEHDVSEEPLLLKIPKLLSPRSSHMLSKPSATHKTGSSGTQTLRVKLTRSKAWLEEYLSSGDPVKVYFSTVYDYHDPSGEFVAELFHELPSRKDYPEYYHVITEPIGLNMVRSRIEDGVYVNLKAIQDDLIQMIKNAHYFNEPGSVVYRAASSLKKFIISRCLELEKRYQTLTKSIQPLKVSLKRPLSVGGEGGDGGEAKVAKLHVRLPSKEFKREKTSQTPSLSDGESDSESGEDVSDSGEGGEGVKTTSKAASSKKHHQTSDFVPRLLIAKNEPSLKKKLMAVYKTVVAKTDKDGRVLSELFMKRPAIGLYPEYYVVISTPIDLREILQKIKTEPFQSLEELKASFELLVSNACTFNEEDSQIYNDALVLKGVATDSCDRLQQAWSKTASTTNLAPMSSSSESNPIFVLLNHIRFFAVQLKSVQVRQVWHSFRLLPPQATNPDYYAAVKRPIDLTTVYNNAHAKKYAGVTQLFEDLHLLCDNACSYYPKDSAKYRDAVLLYGRIVDKYCELTGGEDRRTDVKHYLPLSGDENQTPPPDVKQNVQLLLVDIITKTLDNKDTTGRKLVEAMKGVSATIKPSSTPQEDESEDLPSRSVTLTKIHKLVLQGWYYRLDHLQDDLIAVLQAARAHGDPGSLLGKASAALMKKYVTVRNQVCQDGKKLWSPGLQVTELPLSAEVAQTVPPSLSEEKPAALSRRSRTPSTSAVVGVANEEGAEPVPDDSSCEYIQKAELEGVVYHLGDTVYISNMKTGMNPHIVLIEKLWTDSADKTWLNGCWFYHPEETFHVPTKKFYENEVFKSDFHGVAALTRVQGKCCILSCKDFVKLQPEGYKEEDVYVCEARYSYKAKTFRPIKSARCPGIVQSSAPDQDHLPLLVPRESAAVLKKVPSVFAAQTDSSQSQSMGTGKQEPAQEGDENVIDVETGELDTSVDVLETSFCPEHKNVEVNLPSGGDQTCTYYAQYCIDENHFRLGDFVYLRSDQDLPYIARITKMWTDANGDPWFCGPWFIRPAETQHLPTKLFRDKELFRSNIQDTNPMYSIIGKCAVLTTNDYCRMRPTECSEADVFLVESRYDESEKSFKKLKNLKSFPSSLSVTRDEVYHFSEDHQPLNVFSPSLHSLVESYSIQQKSEHPVILSSAQSSVSPGAVQLPALSASAKASLKQNILQLTPQMVQSILASASQISTTRPVIIPLQQPALTSLPSQAATTTTTTASRTPSPASSSSSSPRLYVCRWEGCGLAFDSLLNLSNHVLAFGIGKKNTHLSKEAIETGSYYCRWMSCARNPTMGGRPFDVFTKLTRHLREVHLFKLSQTALGLSSKTAVTPSPSPLAVHQNIAPHPPSVSQQQLPRRELAVVTGTSTTSNEAPKDTEKDTQESSSKVPNIFLQPPDNRRQLVHSDIYLRHLRGLQNNSKYMSTLDSSKKIRQEQRFNPPKPIQASEWLSSDLIRKGQVAEALWGLRDHMMQDSLRLHRYLEQHPS